jgi:hypothetical protein
MAVDTSALDGFFKVRYADKMENLVPAFAKAAKVIPFKTGEKTGLNYQFPVRLRRSMGITWAGGADYGTAFALNSPVSGVLKNATLTGTEFVLTEYLSLRRDQQGDVQHRGLRVRVRRDRLRHGDRRLVRS